MKRILFTVFVMVIFCLIGYQIFFPLYEANHIIVNYGIHPFDIVNEQPVLWKYAKIWFCFSYLFSSYFFANLFYQLFHHFFQFLPKKERKIKQIHEKKQPNSYSFISPKQKEKLELFIRGK